MELTVNIKDYAIVSSLFLNVARLFREMQRVDDAYVLAAVGSCIPYHNQVGADDALKDVLKRNVNQSFRSTVDMQVELRFRDDQRFGEMCDAVCERVVSDSPVSAWFLSE